MTMWVGLFWCAAGFGLGAAYFWALGWNATLLARPGGASVMAVGLIFVRLAALTGALAIVAIQFGALPLLLATLGFLIARLLIVRTKAALP